MHRDLKPENILMKAAGLKPPLSKELLLEADVGWEVKIGDFGGARLLDSGEMAQTHFCSKRYAAPEVIEQGRYGHAADVWSLGCVFCEMLTGEVSFSPKQKGSGVWDVISRCLVVEEEKRITWQELVEHPCFQEETT